MITVSSPQKCVTNHQTHRPNLQMSDSPRSFPNICGSNGLDYIIAEVPAERFLESLFACSVTTHLQVAGRIGQWGGHCQQVLSPAVHCDRLLWIKVDKAPAHVRAVGAIGNHYSIAKHNKKLP